MVNRERVIKHFMALVQIDSETKHERIICNERKQQFETAVIEDDTMRITGHGAGNVIVNWAATSGAEAVKRWLFPAHMDTVAPGVNVKPQLRQDGTIYSDGTNRS